MRIDQQRLQWVVSPEDSGEKLQAFLKGRLNPSSSAKSIKRFIENGNCSINGRVERFASYIVGNGDRILLYVPQDEGSACSKQHLSEVPLHSASRILYSDNELIIYDKPAGFASDDPRLLSFFKQHSLKAQLVHRLDRDTSGVLIVAKTDEMTKAMLACFKQRMVKKTYLALVDGIVKSPGGTVENFLGPLSHYQGQTIWGEVAKTEGAYAKTVWKTKKMGKEASLVVCHPQTGRTHQLRVHLSGLGHPILGDHQYGRSFHCSYRPKRILLHASEIAFHHPFTKQLICIQAKLPLDFLEAQSILLTADV